MQLDGRNEIKEICTKPINGKLDEVESKSN
jgi:hypothetical protein